MATTQQGITMYDGAQLFMILYICIAEQPIKCQQENIDFQVLKQGCSQMKIYSHANHKDLQLPLCQCGCLEGVVVITMGTWIQIQLRVEFSFKDYFILLI